MLRPLDRRITLQLLVFYCCFLFPVVLGGTQLYAYERDALRQNARRADTTLARSLARDVTSALQPAVDVAVDLSASQTQAPTSGQLDSAQLGAAMATMRRLHPTLSLFMACDPSGHLLVSAPEDSASREQAGVICGNVPAAATAQPVMTTGLTRAGTSAQPLVSVLARVLDGQNRPIGAVGVSLPLDQVTARLTQARSADAASATLRLWVVDTHGRLLAATEPVPFQTDMRARLPGVRDALRGEQGSLTAHSQGADWLLSYEPVSLPESVAPPASAPGQAPAQGMRWAVVVQRPTAVAFAALISVRNGLLIALATLVVGAVFFWLVLHGWVVAPLSALAYAARAMRPDQTEKVSDSDLLTRERERHDEIGALFAAFSTMEDDIHALFQASDARSQVRLQTLDAIMRSMEEGVLLERPDGHIIYANQSCTRFVGLAPQDFSDDGDGLDGRLVEEKLLALIEDPTGYYDALRHAEQTGEAHVVEFQVRGYFNNVSQWVPLRRDIRMRLFQVRDLAGQLVGRGRIFRDVTQQNEAEQIKRNLLAIVSHELRTPLTAIKGYATSLLEPDVTLERALHDHFLQGIVQESDRMAELVTNLLHMSQLEAGTLRLSPSPQRLGSLIERAIPAARRGQVTVALPEDAPLVYVDGRRMEVVLRNLLENAERYAGPDARIEISACSSDDEADATDDRAEAGLHIFVADSGAGLPEQLVERIFDRFYQIDGGRERSSSGVGLGLAICRGFVEAHGGRIWAENRTDGVTGAVFHIWLPPAVLCIPDAGRSLFALDAAL